MAPAAVEASGHQPPLRVVSRRLVKASDPSIQPHTAAVSNIDLYNGGTGQFRIACLYPDELPKAGRSFDDVVAAFVSGLPLLLNHYYPLCGRIAADPTSGLPELHCHNQGADLVVAEVDAALGSLDFGEAETLKKIALPFPDDVGLSVHLLSFACGRIAVVWGINHLLGDGSAITQLIRKWSELSRSGTIARTGEPSHDRSVFRPRDRPSYGARVDKLFTTFDENRMVNVLTAHDSFVERLYYVEAGDLDRLREAASAKGGRRASRVQALSAYLWKALAGVVAASRVPEERCRLAWWVDARQRLAAPELAAVMPNYFGNATTYTAADATVEEVQRKPLADVAAMVREAITAIDYDEYVQEISDWVEEHKEEIFVESPLLGLGAPTLSQTVFASFPLDTDFGFGQAALAMPVFRYTRLSSGFMAISARPAGGDGSWFVSACVWPRLAAALESDEQRIFKPLTAEYLGLL
ncbi:omega-hydroxypalmitate O-feruloyl transferase-like [Panicum miliaceum]|uniref:Omega-hydroxypalmitate O-feruloyl transferase-like n=1 Tax=Panicum miliaceum TaxID=4540 RepID=A0A3L6R9F6_PANMI|nr:omega-hydroxypalmitate O-feruloyl transferase-like [Panicum miliaceum]